MDKTLTDKLNLLINTKTKIQTAITEGGVTVPAELPFNDYDDLIRQLSQVSDTTSTQDLLFFIYRIYYSCDWKVIIWLP